MEGPFLLVVVGRAAAAGAGCRGGGEVGIRVGATNIGRLRGAAAAAARQQGKQHGARGRGVTSWHLRVFARRGGSWAASCSRPPSPCPRCTKCSSGTPPSPGTSGASRVSFPPVQNGSESEDFALWEEPYKQARKWTPCAAKHSLADEEPDENNNGFILISANGGLNQQRVGVCNAVVVAALLNATLVPAVPLQQRVKGHKAEMQMQLPRSQVRPGAPASSSLLVQRLRKVKRDADRDDKQLSGATCSNPGLRREPRARRRRTGSSPSHEVRGGTWWPTPSASSAAGRVERRELQAYRETHFPMLASRLRNAYVCIRHC
ncbi:hypothetical protein HU200_066997 [Digitaria exilis]|uniref:O-fucosyltransferase family protein n=1 Tax=Digitaria exilis TaxID=1010633 RepID=A0A834ZX77_9POAL|nr:hypothetical protein HU200_066997 [Digitaria exilis]